MFDSQALIALLVVCGHYLLSLFGTQKLNEGIGYLAKRTRWIILRNLALVKV
jgi:hypothetical protein